MYETEEKAERISVLLKKKKEKDRSTEGKGRFVVRKDQTDRNRPGSN